jgi:hypothetical protein
LVSIKSAISIDIISSEGGIFLVPSFEALKKARKPLADLKE